VSLILIPYDSCINQAKSNQLSSNASVSYANIPAVIVDPYYPESWS